MARMPSVPHVVAHSLIEGYTMERIFLTRKEVAEACGICERTVDNLEKRGVLKPTRITPRAPRYHVADVHGLKEKLAEKSK